MFLNVPASVFLVSVLVSVPFTTSSAVRNTQYDPNRSARQTSCSQLEFKCNNRECIRSYNVCDGAKDCSDGSDETRSACITSGIKCPSLAFECSYGACIDRELRCNGQSDCADGSDEEGCTTPTPTSGNSCRVLQFKCLNGQCINRYDTCDGVKNCDDGSDETKKLCSTLACPSSSFQCDYGACLEPTVKCDGKSDCQDDSDELNCQNNNPVTRPTFSTPPPEGGCRLPSHPKHGAYTALGQCSANDPRPGCRNTPSTLVSNGWLLKYSCNADYSLNKDSEFSVCENGKWKNELDCIKLCPPLKSLSMNIKCIYKGKEVSCDRPMRPETQATPQCKQYYRPTSPPDYKTTNCLDNGEWTFPLFQCSPVCGARQGGSPTPLAIYGMPSHQGDFPWLAGLYQQNGSYWEQKCGGTLITPHIVLTAAHCLVNIENVRLKPSDLRVGLGKYYRDFYEKESSSLISEVREVVIRKQFAGGSTYYALDIGLLDLVASVQVTAFIMPACVDWSNAFRPAENTAGLVAGWGTTEHGTASEVVLSSQLIYIGYDQCLKMITGAFKGLLTHDKFCGGSGPSGSQVDKGDSGGGLTFVKNDQHFVIGVVSTKIPGETAFTLFTDITNTEHSSWLEEQKNRLREAHRDFL